jgi:hypothetical protein
VAGNDPIVLAEVPASRQGGTLVITVEMQKHSAAVMTADVGKYFAIRGELEGRPVTCHAVLGTATYPASWQAWRIPIEALAGPATVRAAITNSSKAEAQLTSRAYFIPK